MFCMLAVISPGFYPQAKNAETLSFCIPQTFTVVQESRYSGIQNFVTNI